MEFTVEEISPVKRKVAINAAPEEVDAAIAGAVALYKNQVRLDGFRKGKVPAAVVEKRFHDSIYKDAREDLINVHINELFEKTGLEPIGGINMEGDEKPLERGKEFSYTMEFDIMPKFDLPPYEGLEVEEAESVNDEEMVQRLLKRFQKGQGKILPVEGSAPAVDGQIANIDFQGFIDGEPMEDLKFENYDLTIGEDEALPEFIELVKTISPGGEGEAKITFPEDFINPSVAGKTVDMKVKVHAVKKLELPPLDDEFAKKMGKESLEVFVNGVREKSLEGIKDLHKGESQRKLLDGLLKLVDFEIPESLVNSQLRLLLTDTVARLEREGKHFSSLGKSMPELADELRPRAREMARTQILLLAIAKKEGLEVSEREISNHILYECLTSGANYREYRESMEKNGMIFQLRDKLLEDKAMDLVYERANVRIVPEEKSGEAEKGETADRAGEGAASKDEAE